MREKMAEILKEPDIGCCDWELGKVLLANWKAGLPDQIHKIYKDWFKQEVEKLGVISDEKIGDSLDLDTEYTFPCSDGSSVLTFDCHLIAQAQLDNDRRKLLEKLEGQ